VVKFKNLIEQIVETHLYMIAHSPGLVQALNKKERSKLAQYVQICKE